MLHFFKKPQVKNSFDFLVTDMHSHLLPGVDDGSPSVADSLQYIEQLQELGFKKLITTPHIYPVIHPNTPEILDTAFQKLILGNNVNQILSYAAEYFVDKTDIETPLLSFGDRYVLIEISFVGLPRNFEDFLFHLITENYKPVLAHPERYPYLMGNMRFFSKIIEMGCSLQLNINSLGGYYGKQSEEMAWELMKKKLVSFLGTDLHHQKHMDFMKEMATKKYLSKIKDYQWLNIEL